MSNRRGKRRHQRGFSLLEAMISAVILGIGLVGLSQLHMSSIRGTVRAEEIGRAAEVAREIADTLTTLDWNSIPQCGPGPTGQPFWVNPPTAGGGCKAALGPTSVMNPPKPFGCTAWYTRDGVPDLNQPGWVGDPMNGDGSAPDTGNFRVDIALTAHPDTVAFPPASALPPPPGERPVAVLWVWVCWRDDTSVNGAGSVNEVVTTRVVPLNL